MKNKVFVLLLVLSTPLFLLAQKDSTSMDTLLQLSLEQLMNIKVVTASGYLQTTAEAPSTITVITAKQIAERGYEQLEDALRDVPGIDLIHINGYAPTLIYFRGMYGAENLRALLMIDGIVENNILGTNDMAGPAYSLHNVDRIEIIWGPASALYGANAFGGVINIITKKGGDINGFEAEQGYGNFNTSFEKLSFGLRKENLEFAVAGTLYNTDGPKFTGRDPNYSNSYVHNAKSLNTTVSYYANKSKTTFGFRYYDTPMGYGTFFNSPTVPLGLPAPENYNKGLIGIVSSNFNGEKGGLASYYLKTWYVQNEWKPTEKFSLQTTAVFRQTGTDDDSYAYLSLNGKDFIRAIFTSYSTRISGEARANYAPGDNQNFSAGVQYYRDNVEKGQRRETLDLTKKYLINGRDTVYNLNATFLPRVYDIRDNIGTYLQYALKTNILGKTNFTLGSRYDYNSYFGGAFNPRAVVVNQPAENLTFKLQFGTAFRAPTENEINQTPDTFDLKTEKIKTYEFNTIYSFSKKVRGQINLFRNELSDVIVINELAGLNANKNPGSQTTNGIEASLDLILGKNVTGFANFTFQDAKGEITTLHISGQLPCIPKFKGNAGLTFDIENLFTVNIIENWVGKRRVPRTDPYGPVPGYFLTNCVISTKELFNKGITASLNVRNVFNTKWLDPGFRTADGFLFSTVLEQPGINGIFKIGIKL
ncbi:MAG TPA: TonB-dependent receptor [Hanamia sp.]|jgi:outer membrane receptor for ferrienterochelin and colicin|nr:TonB-dependent receptor [Hanamia sp.]